MRRDGGIYLQLNAAPSDLQDRFPEVDAARRQLKRYLDECVTRGTLLGKLGLLPRGMRHSLFFDPAAPEGSEYLVPQLRIPGLGEKPEPPAPKEPIMADRATQ